MDKSLQSFIFSKVKKIFEKMFWKIILMYMWLIFCYGTILKYFFNVYTHKFNKIHIFNFPFKYENQILNKEI